VEDKVEVTNEEELTEEEKKKNFRREVFSWIRVIGFAIIAAVFINNVIIVNASVPTGSMRNTIIEPSRLVAFRLSYVFSEPERFDVIVFRFPDDESTLYVKRIIGMPGERLDIINGQVFINGSAEPLDDSFIREPQRGINQSFIIPEGSYFVMGDNRNDSHDSRNWYNTFLPRENILGKAIFSYFPNIGMIR
jgi:signal peptidase I